MINKQETPQERLDRFSEHLSECQTQLISLAFALVQNMADAEDICQRSAITLWNSFDQYKPGTRFSSWACKITQNEAMNFIRVRRRHRTYFDDQTLLGISNVAQQESDAPQYEAKWAALSTCLDKLPSSQRSLVQLYYQGVGGGEPVRKLSQVATAMGKSEGSVRTALCRIRRMLKECVDGIRERGVVK